MKKAGHEGRVPDRHDDRDPARRPDGRRDRRGGRVLLLRHERPDADDVRLQPRRHQQRSCRLPRAEDPAGRPVPVARRRRRRPAVEMGVDKGRAARKAKTASTSRSASAASTAATRTASPSATRSGWTTSPAPPSACRSPASPPRRPPWPTGRPSAAIARERSAVRRRMCPSSAEEDQLSSGGPRKADRRTQFFANFGGEAVDKQSYHQDDSPTSTSPP